MKRLIVALALCSFVVSAKAQTNCAFEQDRGYPEGRLSFDLDHDGTADSVRVIGTQGGIQRLVVTYSSTGASLESANLDWGYPGSRVWVDMNRDGVPDYCRFVGGQDNQRFSCNITMAYGWGPEVQSGKSDWGYEGSRQWIAATASQPGQFCRNVGDRDHPTRKCSIWGSGGWTD
jgi:hypothetical protein